MTDLLRLALAGTLCFAGIGLSASSGVPSEQAQAAPMAVRFRQTDRRIFLRILRRLSQVGERSVASLEVAAGLDLVGTPYVAGTLEAKGPEQLICNLRGLDCLTFVETALAIALTAKQVGASAPPASAERVFEQEVAALRYRTGRPDGYASRLHYFSDWISHNERRGVIREITRELGGQRDDRPIDFMTAHPAQYPHLADPRVLDEIAAGERELNAAPRWLLPDQVVERVLDQIHDGDILALVPRAPGLDVSHVGLAHRTSDGVLHLLHAPNVGGRVEIGLPLIEYLETHPKIAGIRVLRPV